MSNKGNPQHAERTESRDPAERAVEWVKAHRNQLILGAAIVIAVTASVWFLMTAQQRKEQFAAGELANARAVAATGNLALAASDLDQLIGTYGGTDAGEEAAILLAQIRLMERQPDAAAAGLRELIDAGPSSQFLASAHGLLGNALEESGDLEGAALAYTNASEAAWYDFLKAQYLIDAARAYQTLGDTVAAATIYQQVLEEFEETDQAAVEARVRLMEIQPS